MTSPLSALHETHQARYAGAGAELYPQDYGDETAERQAIEQAVGVFDRSAWDVLTVRGADTVKFLNGLSTNDSGKLKPGEIHGDLLCATKGKVLHAVDVVSTRPDQLLILCLPGEGPAVAAHLEAYHIREEVEIGRVPLTCIDLLGSGTDAALQAMGVEEAIGSYEGAPVIAASQPWGGLVRRVVLMPESLAEAWVSDLLERVPAARLVGWSAYEAARITAGVARFGVDYGTDNLPAEGAAFDRLCFTKGCYVGQEVHARLHYRGHVNRKLMALEVPPEVAADLAPGAALYDGDTEVGHITALTSVAGEGAARAIAMVRHEQAAARTPLSIQPSGDPRITLRPMATDLGAEKG